MEDKPMAQQTITVPTVGRMVKKSDGSYVLDAERSTFATYIIDDVLRYIVMRGFYVKLERREEGGKNQ